MDDKEERLTIQQVMDLGYMLALKVQVHDQRMKDAGVGGLGDDLIELAHRVEKGVEDARQSHE